VARILGAWGVKGALKLKPLAAQPEALFASRRWWVEPGESLAPAGLALTRPGAPAPPQPGLLRIVQARTQGEAIVAETQELGDRDAAQALAGWRVCIARTSFPTPDSDEFYWVDLIGLAVNNRDGVALGEVVGLLETGPHCVLRLRRPLGDADSGERLIPFVAAYVDSVDLAARRIVVDWDPQD
jgi:16S rRNA processing protein RimM